MCVVPEAFCSFEKEIGTFSIFHFRLNKIELNLLDVFQLQNIILKSYSQCLDINWPAYPHSNYWCVRNHCQPWKKQFSIFYSTQQGTLFLELENDWVDLLSHFIKCGERMQRKVFVLWIPCGVLVFLILYLIVSSVVFVYSCGFMASFGPTFFPCTTLDYSIYTWLLNSWAGQLWLNNKVICKSLFPPNAMHQPWPC